MCLLYPFLKWNPGIKVRDSIFVSATFLSLFLISFKIIMQRGWETRGQRKVNFAYLFRFLCFSILQCRHNVGGMKKGNGCNPKKFLPNHLHAIFMRDPVKQKQYTKHTRRQKWWKYTLSYFTSPNFFALNLEFEFKQSFTFSPDSINPSSSCLYQHRKMETTHFLDWTLNQFLNRFIPDSFDFPWTASSILMTFLERIKSCVCDTRTSHHSGL